MVARLFLGAFYIAQGHAGNVKKLKLLLMGLIYAKHHGGKSTAILVLYTIIWHNEYEIEIPSIWQFWNLRLKGDNSSETNIQ